MKKKVNLQYGVIAYLRDKHDLLPIPHYLLWLVLLSLAAVATIWIDFSGDQGVFLQAIVIGFIVEYYRTRLKKRRKRP